MGETHATRIIYCFVPFVLSRYPTLCYAMLCYAMLCYSMLRHAVQCYAMLCYAMLCCPEGLVCITLLFFVNWWIVNGWDRGPDTPSKHTDGGGGSNGFLSKPDRLPKLDKKIYIFKIRGGGRKRERGEGREKGERDRQTDRQKGDRQTDRQTDRQRHRERT